MATVMGGLIGFLFVLIQFVAYISGRGCTWHADYLNAIPIMAFIFCVCTYCVAGPLRRILYNPFVKQLCKLYCSVIYNRHVFDKKIDLDYNPSCVNGTCCINTGAGYINTDTMISVDQISTFKSHAESMARPLSQPIQEIVEHCSATMCPPQEMHNDTFDDDLGKGAGFEKLDDECTITMLFMDRWCTR
jgi:hypothetical protein